MPREIETIISNYLIAQNDDQRLANYEKFGIIWEFSESIPHASQVFSRPMFLILDLLDDRASPLDRRAGESWIRCHLKSYARLLEPFIVSVLDKKILRRDANLSVKWNHQQCKNKDKQEETNIAYFVYPRPFDTDVVDYMFNTLIRLVTFGGLNILKACKGHMLDDSSSTAKIVNESLDLGKNRMCILLSKE